MLHFTKKEGPRGYSVLQFYRSIHPVFRLRFSKIYRAGGSLLVLKQFQNCCVPRGKAIMELV